MSSAFNDLIDECISYLRNDLYEIKHEIKRLEMETKAYNKAISKLESLKEE